MKKRPQAMPSGLFFLFDNKQSDTKGLNKGILANF
jgi:hypothetical protein